MQKVFKTNTPIRGSGLFLFYNLFNMKYKQEHKKIDEMLDILEKRNLNIENGQEILKNINYSHLIYKYSKPFYDFEPKYKIGTKISDLFSLFDFNKKMSLFLYKYLHQFEHKLKKEIASQLTTKNAFYYLEKDKYNIQNTKRQNELEKFIENLKNVNKNVKKNNIDFFNKHSKDGVLSLWNIVDELTIGQLAMLLKFWEKKASDNVYDSLKIDWKELALIRRYRNIIGHMNVISSKIPYKIKGGKTTLYSYFSNLLSILFRIFPECEEEFVLILIKYCKNKRHKNIIKYIFCEYFKDDNSKIFRQLNSYKWNIKRKFLKLWDI